MQEDGWIRQPWLVGLPSPRPLSRRPLAWPHPERPSHQEQPLPLMAFHRPPKLTIPPPLLRHLQTKGLLDGKAATAHPAFAEKLADQR